MTKEFIAALTVLGLFVGAVVLFLMRLAFSGLKKPGQLSDQWEPDQERSREYKMKARNER